VESGEDDIHTLGNRLSAAVDHDLRIERLLVRVRDAGKLFNFAGQGFFVEPFDVAGDEGFQRAPHVHFDEVTDTLTDFVADGAIGGNRRGNSHSSIPGQEMCDVTDAANVGVTIFFGKP